MMSDSLFSDAGWFFFAIWSIAVATVSIAAFGRDLLPSKAANSPVRSASSTQVPRPNWHRPHRHGIGRRIGNVGTAAFGCPPGAAGLGLPTW